MAEREGKVKMNITQNTKDDNGMDFAGLVRSLEDLEIANKMLALTLIYNPMTLIGLLADMEHAGFGFADALEIAPDEPCNTDRVCDFANDKNAQVRMLANLRTAIQQFALNVAFEAGEKVIRAAKHGNAIKDEPWFRMMTALRNAIVHSSQIEDKRHKLFHAGEDAISWNGITLRKSDIGNRVTKDMVAKGAVWKLIRKMRDVVQELS